MTSRCTDRGRGDRGNQSTGWCEMKAFKDFYEMEEAGFGVVEARDVPDALTKLQREEGFACSSEM
jgi:hypothetical protein